MIIKEELIIAWLRGFSRCVNEKNYEAGKQFFDDVHMCFGSFSTKLIRTLDDLVEMQWKMIWPNIRNFEYDLSSLVIETCDCDSLACAIVPYKSVGYNNSGISFNRSGRATIILKWSKNKNKWLSVHSHHSLAPGTPVDTHKNNYSD